MAIARRKAKKKAAKKKVVRKAAKKRVVRRRAGAQFFGTTISAFGARPKETPEYKNLVQSLDWSAIEMNFEDVLRENDISGRKFNDALNGFVDGVKDGIRAADWRHGDMAPRGQRRVSGGRKNVAGSTFKSDLVDRYASRFNSEKVGGVSRAQVDAYRMGYDNGFRWYCDEYSCDDFRNMFVRLGR